MKKITYKDYLNFLKENDYVIIGKNKIKLHREWAIKYYAPKDNYQFNINWLFSRKVEGDIRN
ncbi:MAG: hypothetical protein N2323_05160 [candidate division WOR-3 bacterium]|nr:hypothetical protein [candidate division WOR-3 bacterium]MCX7837329.1 hypothetical protein [candidate division WOR-3 bacterium]MDW8114608.1 hypothetical protein [candidate division WOR-3 bacterium]